MSVKDSFGEKIKMTKTSLNKLVSVILVLALLTLTSFSALAQTSQTNLQRYNALTADYDNLHDELVSYVDTGSFSQPSVNVRDLVLAAEQLVDDSTILYNDVTASTSSSEIGLLQSQTYFLMRKSVHLQLSLAGIERAIVSRDVRYQTRFRAVYEPMFSVMKEFPLLEERLIAAREISFRDMSAANALVAQGTSANTAQIQTTLTQLNDWSVIVWTKTDVKATSIISQVDSLRVDTEFPELQALIVAMRTTASDVTLLATNELSDIQTSINQLTQLQQQINNVNNPQLTANEQTLKDLQDQFDGYQNDFDDLEDDYRDAVRDDDNRDIEKYKNKLEDLRDDELEDLLEEIEDLIDDAEDDNEDQVAEDAEELEDNVKELQDDIDRVIGPRRESAPSYNLPSTSSRSTTTTTTTNNQPVEVETVDYVPTLTTNTNGAELTFESYRKVLWLGAGLIVVLAVIIFLIAVLLKK